MPCLCCKYYFVYKYFSFIRVLFKVYLKGLSYGLVHHTHYFRVAQFRLCLSFKLRLRYFNGNYCCQALSEVIARNLYFCLFQHLAVVGIFL